jgi:DNA polymerase-1
VTTLLGRRRSVRELYESYDPRTRAAADNVAVNTPIQGSAADIIQVAMLRLHSEMNARGMRSVMTMQVHDELVFDVAPGEADALETLVRDKMEGAYSMRVPLVVDMGSGANWLIAH